MTRSLESVVRPKCFIASTKDYFEKQDRSLLWSHKKYNKYFTCVALSLDNPIFLEARKRDTCIYYYYSFGIELDHGKKNVSHAIGPKQPFK